MIARIHINKQIGNSYDDNGVITERGIELQDVVSQVEANKGAEAIFIYIKSGGGCYDKGKAIAKYVSSLENCYTVADEICGSAATEIALAVPVANRKIIAGTEYFIHNPLLDGVRGDSAKMAEASEFLLKPEKEMLAMYVNTTTTSKEALQGLMKQETGLTAEECITLGFCSEIIPKQELKAIAFVSNTKKVNKDNSNIMSLKKAIKEGFAGVLAELKNPTEVKAMTVETDKGVLSYESEGSAPAVDEVVSIDGVVAAEGSYISTDETVITVGENGIVTEVAPKEVEAVTIESLQAKIVELEANKETEKAELKAELEAEMTETFEAELEVVKAELIKFKGDTGSNFVPKASKPKFNKNATPAVVSMKEQRAARKAKSNK